MTGATYSDRSLITDGVKTYTYDSANRLVEVSDPSGTVSMGYNGLGQRLSMDAAGVIAHYVMDGNQPLTATSAGNTTFYLYGLGTIGEKTSTWSYSLPDGTNTPRQLSNLTGSITLSARYTPWGDALDTYGTGHFTFGYFGGVTLAPPARAGVDAATGLLYVGNGQYYDPATGRFLTRDAKPNNSNPYVPWDPTGAIVGSLSAMALLIGKKKKGSKAGTLLVLLVVLGSVGMTLAACGSGPTPPAGSNSTPPTIPAQTQTPVPTGPGNTPTNIPSSTPSPVVTLTLPDCATPTGTPISSCPVCASNQYAQILYDAVISQKNNLPPGFSVALLFAVAAVETGGNNPAYQNSVTHGGAFQLRANSGHYHHPYEDSPAGYEQNVIDAIAVINENYNYAESTKEQTLWQVDLYGQFPDNQNGATAARTVLYYNGGFGWWDKNNPDSYVNNPANKPYVGNVAGMLANYVPSSFGFSDPSLVTILQKVQDIVNVVVK